jgi:hypothetical protein
MRYLLGGQVDAARRDDPDFGLALAGVLRRYDKVRVVLDAHAVGQEAPAVGLALLRVGDRGYAHTDRVVRYKLAREEDVDRVEAHHRRDVLATPDVRRCLAQLHRHRRPRALRKTSRSLPLLAPLLYHQVG